MPITITNVNLDDTVQDSQLGNFADGTNLEDVERSNIVDQHGTVLAALNVEGTPDQVTFDVGSFIDANMRFGTATYEALRDIALDADSGPVDIDGQAAELISEIMPPLAPSHLIATLTPIDTQKVAVCPGLADGDGFDAPFSGSRSELGIYCDVQPTDWRGGVNSMWVMRDNTTFGRSFGLYLSNADEIRAVISVDGTNARFPRFIPPGFSGNQRVKLRYHWNGATGVSRLWWRIQDGDSWNELIDQSTPSDPGSYPDNIPTVSIGMRPDGRNPSEVLMHSAAVYDGDPETADLLLSFNPNDADDFGEGVSWNSEATGETWQAQGAARLSALNVLVYDEFSESDDGTLLEDHTPNVGGPWQQGETANYTIEDGAVERRSGDAAGSAWIETNTPDSIVEMDFVDGATNGQAILFVRGDSEGNKIYDARIRPSITQFEIRDDGVVVESEPLVGVYPIRMYLSIQGDVVTAWTDKGNSLTYNGATVGPNNTYVGFQSTGSDLNTGLRRDNFLVTSITDEPVTDER